jgi:hypothetical protein
MQTDCSPDPIHNCRQLRVETALSAPHGLIGLAADRVRGVSVNLDVGAVDTPDLPNRPAGDGIEQPRPQARSAPASEPSVNRASRTKAGWQITPWDSGSQDVPHAGDHESVILTRSASSIARGPLPIFGAVRSIFLAAPRAARATPSDL